MDGSTGSFAPPPPAGGFQTLASAPPGRGQHALAAAVCAAFALATAGALPWAAAAMPPMPGFLPGYQCVLIAVYALTTQLFFSQHRHARLNRTTALPLLVLGAGSLYTTLIVAAQLLSFPGLLAPGRLLGDGPETTTWLWTLWHLGPPFTALVYALVETRPARRFVASDRHSAGWIAAFAAVAAAAFATLLVTRFVDWLPRTVVGDDYTRLISTGIGPGIVGLTLLALGVLCWATRLRTVLQLWLAVSLLVLVCDNVVTLAGGARATAGWLAGRIDALVAGLIVLAVYLRQIDSLHGFAEATATSREAARAALERARDHLDIALEAAGMGDWEFDLRTGLAQCTLRHDQIFGYRDPVSHWSRARFIEHVVPEDREAATAALDQAEAQGRLEMECRIRRADDDAIRWIALRGRIRYDESGRPCRMAGIVMDTTDRHAAETRAKQAERMEALGQLTGGVAHDFNNLLTVVVGNLERIAERAREPAEVARLAGVAMTAAKRGADVTGKLLSFSSRQMARPQLVNVNRLVSDLLPRLQRVVGSNLSLDLDPTLDPVIIDPAQLESALLSLLLNAKEAQADADGGGGPIEISTGGLRIAGGEGPDDGKLRPGDYVRITVRDHGVGMDSRIVAHAFEPFFTTKEAGKAAGLGLSQVYGFARQARGNVRINSAPGLGTTVELLLPQTRSSGSGGTGRQPDRLDADALPLRRSQSGEVVLVVEDEAVVREMAVESLEELGYRTLEASDAAQALERLASDELIDIMFSDVVMPGGMNGVQLAVEARRLRPRLKILLTSGYTALTDDRTVPSDVLLLPKPYRRAQLATKLQVVMGR